MNTMTTTSIERYKKHWIFYSMLGILLIVLGTVGASYSVAVTAFAMLWIGVILIIAAVFQFITACYAAKWSGFFVHLILSIITLLMGIFIIAYPLKASVIFTLFIGVYLILAGILRIIFSIQVRKFDSWWIFFIAGLISLILGILILAHWPISGLWVFGLFVCVEVILMGISMIFMTLLSQTESY